MGSSSNKQQLFNILDLEILENFTETSYEELIFNKDTL